MWSGWYHIFHCITLLSCTCESILLPTLHVGVSFDTLVSESPVHYFAKVGGSTIKCSPQETYEYVQACVVRNVCLDALMSKNLEIYPDNKEHYKISPSLLNKKLYFPRTQKYREGPQLYSNLELPFVQLVKFSSGRSGRVSGGRSGQDNPFRGPGKSDNTGVRTRARTRSSSSRSLSIPSSFYLIEKPIVLVDILYADNYGHTYVDYVTSAYAGARMLDEDIKEFAIMPSRAYSYNSSEKFEYYIQSLLKLSLSHDLRKYAGNIVCFSKLLLPGYHGLFSNFSSAVTRYSQSLRDDIYKFNSSPLPYLSDYDHSSPLILMAYKKQHLSVHGGRILLNVAEVGEALRKRFGNAVLMLDLGDVSLGQQVALMRHVSIFVSPTGGASFSAMLLRDGAVYINIESFNPITNQSEPAAQPDHDSMQRLKHLHILQHKITRDEVILESNAKARTKRFKFSEGYFYKLMGNYQLDTKSLLHTLESALQLLNV